MLNKLKDKATFTAGTMVGDHKQLNQMILEETTYFDHYKRLGEKQVEFTRHLCAYSEQECTPFMDGTRQLATSAEAALPVSQNLINIGANEVELLKQVLAKAKSTDKARDTLKSAEKTRASAKLQSDKDAADREVETCRANLEQAEGEYLAYAQEKLRDALISREKALVEYHQEMMRSSQQNLEILQGM